MLLSIASMFPRKDRIHVVRDNETETWRSDFSERRADVPQLLLVEQEVPGSQILPHFHAIDQFQVFVDGSGRLGHHAVEPIAIHYTNSYTGYGPIVAGENGFSYYVMRPGFDVQGSHYLHVPEARAKLKPGGKRFILAEGIKVSTLADLAALKAAAVERVIGVDGPNDPEAGVFADIVRLPPGAAYTGADPATGNGQVFMVLQGAIVHAGNEMGLRASIAITPDEGAVSFCAGSAGAQVMALQYPRRS